MRQHWIFSRLTFFCCKATFIKWRKKILEFLFYGHFRNKNDSKNFSLCIKFRFDFISEEIADYSKHEKKNLLLMKNWEESFLFKRVITVQSTRKKVKEKAATMHILSNKATQIAFAFFFWVRNFDAGIWSGERRFVVFKEKFFF